MLDRAQSLSFLVAVISFEHDRDLPVLVNEPIHQLDQLDRGRRAELDVAHPGNGRRRPPVRVHQPGRVVQRDRFPVGPGQRVQINLLVAAQLLVGRSVSLRP